MIFPEEPQIITTDADLLTLCAHLQSEEKLAVDLEGDSLHHFKERLCLLQVSDSKKDYIVDLMTIQDFQPMKQLLEDPTILKVMHGADYDIVSLKRDYNCRIVNLFDTALAAQFLNYEKFGLANLMERHFGLYLEKQYQKHDWSRRPLYPEHIEYARMDTHYLLALHEILQRQLVRSGYFDACIEESESLTHREWNGRQFDGCDFLRVKKAHGLKDESLKVLRALFELRDQWSSERDVPVFHFATDGVLWAIAAEIPSDSKTLLACLPPKNIAGVRKKVDMLLEAVEKSKIDQRELPRLADEFLLRPKNKWLNEIVNQLRDWRSAQKETGLHDFLLPTNNQIKDIAFDLPKTLDDLAQLGSFRTWQIRLWGEAVLDVVATVLENSLLKNTGKSSKSKKSSKSS